VPETSESFDIRKYTWNRKYNYLIPEKFLQLKPVVNYKTGKRDEVDSMGRFQELMKLYEGIQSINSENKI
jgi:tRNA U38,U39,U40 pseudouridine synthase TruA